MILVTLAYMEGWTDERTNVRTYIRTVDDVMVIKPRFLASMGYHIFLTMVLHASAPLARAELRFEAIDVGSWSFVGSNVPVRNESRMK